MNEHLQGRQTTSLYNRNEVKKKEPAIELTPVKPPTTKEKGITKG
jgi:hypothetical protein